MKLTYDIHTHILPGIDDGAKTAEEGAELLSALQKQGVTDVCLTPHFYSHKQSITDFCTQRDAAYRDFLPFVPEGMRVYLGAEVFVTKYMFADDCDLTPLCYKGTNYMLTEFSYTSRFKEGSMRNLVRLISRGIMPVIPHVERYRSLMKDSDLLAELIYMGITIQTNTSSLIQSADKHRLIKYIKSGYIQLLGTDAHSFTHNDPRSLNPACELIAKKCGSAVLGSMNSNAAELLGINNE